MAESKLAYFKKALAEQGPSEEQWEDWLDIASETVWATRETLEHFEPYATTTISALKEVEEYLLTLKEELQGEVP